MDGATWRSADEDGLLLFPDRRPTDVGGLFWIKSWKFSFFLGKKNASFFTCFSSLFMLFLFFIFLPLFSSLDFFSSVPFRPSGFLPPILCWLLQDKENADGGKLSVLVRKHFANRCWEEVLMAVVGDSYNLGDAVCGVTISLKFHVGPFPTEIRV